MLALFCLPSSLLEPFHVLKYPTRGFRPNLRISSSRGPLAPRSGIASFPFPIQQDRSDLVGCFILQTCCHMREQTSRRSIWKKALNFTTWRYGLLYAPGDLSESLTLPQIQRLALGPHRWDTLTASHSRNPSCCLPLCPAIGTSPSPTARSSISLNLNSLGELEETVLFPGGRYLLTASVTEDEAGLRAWDLGPPGEALKKCKLLAKHTPLAQWAYMRLRCQRDGGTAGVRVVVCEPGNAL